MSAPGDRGRAHLSIGEVLNLLQGEFPDVTISKIRFLESQGLIDPERTPSGYRKFYEPDIERLRFILTQQRDHFLPLRVIKDRLGEAALGGPGHAGDSGRATAVALWGDDGADTPAGTATPTGGGSSAPASADGAEPAATGPRPPTSADMVSRARSRVMGGPGGTDRTTGPSTGASGAPESTTGRPDRAGDTGRDGAGGATASAGPTGPADASNHGATRPGPRAPGSAGATGPAEASTGAANLPTVTSGTGSSPGPGGTGETGAAVGTAAARPSSGPGAGQGQATGPAPSGGVHSPQTGPGASGAGPGGDAAPTEQRPGRSPSGAPGAPPAPYSPRAGVMSGTADLADAPGGGGEAGLGGQAGQLGQSGPAAAGAPEGAVRVPPWVARANESARGGQRGRRAAAPAAGDDTAGAPLRGAGAPSAAQLRSASRGSDDQVRGDRGRRSGAQVAGGPTTGRGPDDGPGPFPGDEPGGTPGGGHGGGHEEPSGGAGQGTPRAGDRGGNDERPDGNAAARDVTSVQMSTDELVVACGISPAQLADLERFGLVSCRHVAGGRFYDDDAVVVCRLAARFAVYGIEARHLRMFKVAAEREVALYEQVVAPLTHGRDRQGASSRAADVLGQLSGLGEAMRSALVQRAARPETGGH